MSEEREELIAKTIANELGEEWELVRKGPDFEPSASQDDYLRAARAVLLAHQETSGCPTCKSCQHFLMGQDDYGACRRWNVGYGYDPATMPLNEVLVEDDEGWAMVVGPEFGCVLHEPSPSPPTSQETT